MVFFAKRNESMNTSQLLLIIVMLVNVGVTHYSTNIRGDKKMSLSRLEQETVINFNAEEGQADLYTADPVWIRKLDGLCEKNPEQFRMIEEHRAGGKVISRRYIFPKQLITIRSKTMKRDLTDEQRELLSERGRELQRARRLQGNN